MYLRRTQRHNKNSVVRYVQLAHNRRVNGKTQAEVLANLGREDQLDLDGLARLVASINRYLGERGDLDPAGAAGEAAGEVVATGETGQLEVESARSFGAVWLLDQLWQRLRIDSALASVVGGRRLRTDVERVLFALVANRAIAPTSKLAAG